MYLLTMLRKMAQRKGLLHVVLVCLFFAAALQVLWLNSGTFRLEQKGRRFRFRSAMDQENEAWRMWAKDRIMELRLKRNKTLQPYREYFGSYGGIGMI